MRSVSGLSPQAERINVFYDDASPELFPAGSSSESAVSGTLSVSASQIGIHRKFLDTASNKPFILQQMSTHTASKYHYGLVETPTMDQKPQYYFIIVDNKSTLHVLAMLEAAKSLGIGIDAKLQAGLINRYDPPWPANRDIVDKKHTEGNAQNLELGLKPCLFSLGLTAHSHAQTESQYWLVGVGDQFDHQNTKSFFDALKD